MQCIFQITKINNMSICAVKPVYQVTPH